MPGSSSRPQSRGQHLGRDGITILATDQSIQARGGGTGFAIDLQRFKRTYFNSELYFTGVYLFNPRDTNGLTTNRTRPGEQVMSVTDPYLYRGGIGHAVPRIRGDRPGPAVRSRSVHLLRERPPWAVQRNRKRSVSGYQNGIHGDAAFADYAVLASVSRRF